MLAALICNLGVRPVEPPASTPGYTRREVEYLRSMGREPMRRERARELLRKLEQAHAEPARMAARGWLYRHGYLLDAIPADPAVETTDVGLPIEIERQQAFSELLRMAQLFLDDELILLLA